MIPAAFGRIMRIVFHGENAVGGVESFSEAVEPVLDRRRRGGQGQC
jgi:hypothetical protein